MLTFHGSQLASLRASALEQFDLDTATYLLRSFADHFLALGVGKPELTSLVSDIRAHSADAGFSANSDIQKLAVVAITLGSGFLRDPRFQYEFSRWLFDESHSSEARVAAVIAFATHWTDSVWADDAPSQFGDRLISALRAEAERLSDQEIVWCLLRDLLPGHWVMLTETQHKSFFNACFRQAGMVGLSRPDQLFGYTACAMAHGFGWWADAQFSRLQGLFENPSSAFVNNLSDFYDRFD